METLPPAVRLVSPFSFVEQIHNKGRFDWRGGEVVTNPKTIALLKERGAPIEEIHDPA
ncbi:hypothetical protein [Acetobacter aceti]|uniref:Uncharacterized protein n=1 Tax=Acetobacter aceti TaxID=435 RepID=A0A6S6PGF9_ACEAC|nr:hypothetical protein [Acetobacter aceti]BCI68097.1 hypothetical protein AAJCM20276_27210 [Acetobacter aceti]